jgi:hypothetical protein
MRKLAEEVIGGLTLLFLSAGLAYAKLPPPSEEAKAKSEEAKAKADYGDKVGAYKLCLAQNRVAEHYQKAKGEKPQLTACQDPGPFGAAPPAAPDAKAVQATPEKKK